jgi:hypothetical protein
MGIKKAATAMAMAIGTALSAAVLAAPPAQAATIGYVYISFPKWLANCPNGGSAKTIWADDGWQVWNADAGDDLIYGRVALGQTNTISYTLFCAKWPAGYYQPGYQTRFVPTRNNQTVWVGPAGWTRN